MMIWWPLLDLNQRPGDYESPALTTELKALNPVENQKNGDLYGTRTRVARVKGGSPGPLDERDF